MKIFQKIKNRIKQNDGSYLLTSFWTSADSIEMDDGRTLTRFKTDTDTAIGGKGDGLSYDEETNMLYLLSGDRQISGVEIISSGASGKVLGDVTGVEAIPQTASVTIKWTDPSDDGDVVWAGTTLIRKKWSRPVDCLDGTVVVESTTRNQYKTTGYVDDELDSNTTYYYRFFPYDTQGHIRTGLAVAVNTLKDETVIDEFPEVTGTYTYNGSLQEVQLSNFDSDKMVISSGGTATNAGTYSVSVAPVSGLKWPDNTTDAISLSWTINKAKIAYTPSQIGEVTYTGSSRTPGWSNYDESQLAISGTTSATDVGDYTATFTPTSNYTWYDGSVTGRDVTWTLSRATIAVVPSQNGTLTYTGSEQSPTWNNYDNTKMTISGQTSGTDAGTYTAVFTPTSNYKWSDGTVAGKQVSWSIGATSISTLPSQSGTLTYDGTTQTPSWSNYDSSKLTLGGATSAKNAGTYTAVFTPRTGYSWWDGTTEAKSASWTIGRQTVSSPTASGTLTYNGSTQYPAWSGYDSDKMTIGGTTSATDAGTYSATFVPTSNYCWSGGGTGTKSVSWVINKANGTLTLSKLSMSFSAVNDTDISTGSGYYGSLSATTGSSSVATVSVSGSTITVVGKGDGSTSVTVTASGDVNHYSVSKTISITVEIIQPTLISENVFDLDHKIQHTDDWGRKSWSGLSFANRDYIWSDGTNIYYSNGSTQKVLDLSTSKWENMAWSGLAEFNGSDTWKDGENVYCTVYQNGAYSYYELNKSNSTWVSKVWYGLDQYSSLTRSMIWTDGENVYYGYYKVLNRDTSTWENKTWNGDVNGDLFFGYNVWSDGDNIYYSYDKLTQKVLNKQTSTWEDKEWSGFGNINWQGNYIWTDGENLYYSKGSIQKVLSKSTSTWNNNSWNYGSDRLDGSEMWTDGSYIYCSDSTYNLTHCLPSN